MASLTTMRSRSRSRDNFLNAEGEDVRFINPNKDEEEIPYRSILIAVGLLLVGVFFLTAGAVNMFRKTTGDGGADIAFIVLGCLTFIPGFWATRIAYYKWRGVEGYSYSDIPS